MCKPSASSRPPQDGEPHAGPGRELRGGPGLHHGADHLRLLPQLGGGAELCRQPARGGHHAALQTRKQLPGTAPGPLPLLSTGLHGILVG